MSDFTLIMVTWWVSCASMALIALALPYMERAAERWQTRRRAERRARSERYIAGERRRWQ